MPDTASTPLPSRKQMCNALRALAMGAVQKANSGHAGMPMGMMEGISHEAASLALQAQGQIAQAGVPVRVVSIPSTSAPAADVYRHFGLTVENLVATVQAVLSRESKS